MSNATGFLRNFKSDVSGNSAATVTADSVVMTRADGNSVNLPISSTLDTTGTGLNKLDTGTVANSSWYYLWAVSNGTTSGVVASTSSSAPDSSITNSYPYVAQLPATLRTNGSANLLATRARGSTNQYVVGGVNVSAYPTVASGSAGTFSSGLVTAFSAASVSSIVPTNVTSNIKLLLEQGFNLAAFVSPNSSTAPNYGAGSTNPAWGGCQGGNVGNQYQGVEFLLESTDVYYAGLGASSGLYCLGWEHN